MAMAFKSLNNNSIKQAEHILQSVPYSDPPMILVCHFIVSDWLSPTHWSLQKSISALWCFLWQVGNWLTHYSPSVCVC